MKENLENVKLVMLLMSPMIAVILSTLVAFGTSDIERIFMTRKKIYANNNLIISTMVFAELFCVYVNVITNNGNIWIYCVILVITFFLTGMFTVKAKKASANKKNQYISYAGSFFLISIALFLTIISNASIISLYYNKNYTFIGLWIVLIVIIMWIITYLVTAKGLEAGKEKLYYIENNEKRYIYMAKDKEYVYVGKSPTMTENKIYFLISISELYKKEIIKDENA